jgi:hypothetical protein
MPDDTAALQPAAEEVTALNHLMRAGRTGEAERAIGKLSKKLGGGEDGQEAALAAVLAEPQIQKSLSELEHWLDGQLDLKAAAPVATWWAIPASGVDLEERVNEVRLFIDNYPSEGRKIPILQASATDWLVRRMELLGEPADRLGPIRASFAMLVRATRMTYPDTSTNFEAVLNEYNDDQLWFAMAEMIVRSQLVVRD